MGGGLMTHPYVANPKTDWYMSGTTSCPTCGKK